MALTRLGSKAITSVENTAINLDAAEIPNLDASKIQSGVLSDARISASSVSQHAQSFDDNKIVNDISTLALRQASNENKAAYNTQSMFVDVFQDSSGIMNLVNAQRDDSEFISSVSTTNESGGTLRNINDASWNHYGSNYGFNYYSDTIETDYDSTTYNFSTYSHSEVSGKFWFRWKISDVNGTNETSNNPRFQMGIMNNTDTLNTGNSLQNSNNAANKPQMFHLGYRGKNGGNLYFYKGGTLQATVSKTLGHNHSLQIVGDGSTLKVYHSATENNWYDSGADLVHTYADFTDSGSAKRLLVGNGNENTPDGTYMLIGGSWKEDIINTYGLVANATGSFESNPITAPSSVNKMGAIITYQNQAGVNALNTDIVLKLSADGGSNYSTATLTAMPDFASGIKMAKVNDLSVQAGTSLKYKIEFANQADGVKEARIRGCSLQF